MQKKIEEWFKVLSWKYSSRIHIYYYNLDKIFKMITYAKYCSKSFHFWDFFFLMSLGRNIKNWNRKNADLFMGNKSLQRKKFTFMGKWKVKYLIHNILRTKRGFLALQLNNRKLEEWSIQNFQKTISKHVHYFSGILYQKFWNEVNTNIMKTNRCYI